MALLNSKYSLLGISDVEAFTAHVLQRSGLELSYHDRQKLHVHLIEECWRLSFKHDPERAPFEKWIGSALSRSITDWQRKRYGRTRWVFKHRVYERPRPQLVSLDADDPDGDRLDAALASWESDPASSRDPDLGGLLAGGDRQRARDLDTLGLEPPRRAAG